jgi:Domain of unknown function (DUF4406)
MGIPRSGIGLFRGAKYRRTTVMMRRDCLVYLAGPITPKNGVLVEEHVTKALRVYLSLIRDGIPAFCPQLCAAFPSAFTVPYDQWIAIDRVLIDRCTHVFLLDGWQESEGARREAEYAEEQGKILVDSMEALETVLGIRPLVLDPVRLRRTDPLTWIEET